MSLIACPECMKQISDTADSCPKCGYQLTPEKIAEIKAASEKTRKRLRMCLIPVLLVILVLILVKVCGEVLTFGEVRATESETSHAVQQRQEFQERVALEQQDNEQSSQVIGTWVDERPFALKYTTIVRQGGKLFMEHRQQKEGSSIKHELVEKDSPLGQRFDKVEGGSPGDYWILDSRGKLQIYDSVGLIVTLKR